MPIEHDHINTEFSVNVADAFSMQKIYAEIQKAYPTEPGVTVTSITVPLLSIVCKDFGIIDPINDIKNAVTRLYNKFMQAFVNPIWTALYALYNALKKFGLQILDLKLPVFNLHISDLFRDDIYDTIKAIVTDLYKHAQHELERAMNILKIPYNLLDDIASFEKHLESIIKNIMVSLWDALLRLIKKIIDLIQKGLQAYDLLVYKILNLSLIWKAAIDKFLKQIIDLLTHPPSIEDIKNAIYAFVQRLKNKIGKITCWDVIQEIEKFALPIVGLPMDWYMPLNPKVNTPCIDLAQIIADMKLWINNFVLQLVKKFIQAVNHILEIFALKIHFPTIHVPITLCIVRATPTPPPKTA